MLLKDMLIFFHFNANFHFAKNVTRCLKHIGFIRSFCNVAKTNMDVAEFSEPPEKPTDADCCGSGCNPCVFDVYEEQLKEWKLSQSKGVRTSDTKTRHDLLSQVRFKPFKLLSIKQHTRDTFVYTFQPDLPSVGKLEVTIEGILPYKPGQYVIATTHDFNTEKTCLDEVLSDAVARDYTPLSLAEKQKNCVVDILVKLYPMGRMSNYLRLLKPGDKMYFRGTGIAPVYSLFQVITDNDNDETIIQLCFACRTMDDILLRNELRNYSRYWNFKCDIYLSEEGDWEKKSKEICYGENIHGQRITLQTLRGLIKPEKSHFFLICGTESFNNDMSSYIKELGYSEENIYIY